MYVRLIDAVCRCNPPMIGQHETQMFGDIRFPFMFVGGMCGVNKFRSVKLVYLCCSDMSHIVRGLTRMKLCDLLGFDFL